MLKELVQNKLTELLLACCAHNKWKMERGPPGWSVYKYPTVLTQKVLCLHACEQ